MERFSPDDQRANAARNLSFGQKLVEYIQVSGSDLDKAEIIAPQQRLAQTIYTIILAEKRQVIRKSGLLEYTSADENLANVGGLDNLKRWLARRGAAFGDKARAFGLPAPKGLLLLGVQGCGKSLTAKAVAASWKLPLLRLDIENLRSTGLSYMPEGLEKQVDHQSMADLLAYLKSIK